MLAPDRARGRARHARQGPARTARSWPSTRSTPRAACSARKLELAGRRRRVRPAGRLRGREGVPVRRRRRRRDRRHVRRGRRARGPASSTPRGIPFLVTSATRERPGQRGHSQSTFMMNGTVYQQALSSVFWMNYRQAQRLAVVQDDSAESKALAREAIGAGRGRAQARVAADRRARRAGHEDDRRRRGRLQAELHPLDRRAGEGGELVKALRAAGYKGTFSATAAVRVAGVPDRRGRGGRRRLRHGHRDARTTRRWPSAVGRELQGPLPARARLRGPAGLRLRAARSRTRSRRPRPPTAQGRSRSMTTLDPDFVNSLGVVRFAHDHTLLYDNRVILKVKNGALHLGAVAAHRLAGVSCGRARPRSSWCCSPARSRAGARPRRRRPGERRPDQGAGLLPVRDQAAGRQPPRR